MKKYLLEIYFEDDGTISSHEKAEGLSITEIRLLVSALEEVKLSMIIAIKERGSLIDLKKQPKQ